MSFGFGGGSNNCCWIIIILIVLCVCCGNTDSCGCGNPCNPCGC